LRYYDVAVNVQATRNEKWMTLTGKSTLRDSMCVVTLLLAAMSNSVAAELTYDIRGVSDPLLANIQSHAQAFSISRQSDVSAHDFDSILSESIEKSKAALRPYGYYHPDIRGNVEQNPNGDTVVRLTINAGAPIIIDQVNIEVQGSGADRSTFVVWRNSWPLVKGSILDQAVWEERKQFALDEANRFGYLSAHFAQHKLELDLNTNRANLTLTLDTGDRFRIGDINYGEHVLKPGIVEHIARFQEGAYYSRRLMSDFRMDLWKTGYFTDVIVEETLRADVQPPVVDLDVRFETTSRNTYQGSLGLGSDTGMRVQAQWSKHPMSSNGDRLDLGIGWQERDDEYSLIGNYRLPRRDRARQFWTSSMVVRREDVDIDVRPTPNDDFFRLASGKINEQHLRLGRLKVRNFKSGEQQAFETLFVQGLHADNEFRLGSIDPDFPDLSVHSDVEDRIRASDNTISFGFDYDLIAVGGKGWETTGHREQALVFASSKSLGSDRNFAQAYVSTRRSYLRGDRWRFLVRAELGYTDATVDSYDLDTGDEVIPLSITELPNYYRFKAGGSNSVRGYGFEDLSNNHIGSNHIATASVEAEMKFLDNWSAAVFVDVGNAFNDWANAELKVGAGVGLRWYSIAGPIRIDVAQGMDLEGKPWRVHFTIGTPLL
jgi:translocation and assembly module TamA